MQICCFKQNVDEIVFVDEIISTKQYVFFIKLINKINKNVFLFLFHNTNRNNWRIDMINKFVIWSKFQIFFEIDIVIMTIESKFSSMNYVVEQFNYNLNIENDAKKNNDFYQIFAVNRTKYEKKKIHNIVNDLKKHCEIIVKNSIEKLHKLWYW